MYLPEYLCFHCDQVSIYRSIWFDACASVLLIRLKSCYRKIFSSSLEDFWNFFIKGCKMLFGFFSRLVAFNLDLILCHIESEQLIHSTKRKFIRSFSHFTVCLDQTFTSALQQPKKRLPWIFKVFLCPKPFQWLYRAEEQFPFTPRKGDCIFCLRVRVCLYLELVCVCLCKFAWQMHAFFFDSFWNSFLTFPWSFSPLLCCQPYPPLLNRWLLLVFAS